MSISRRQLFSQSRRTRDTSRTKRRRRRWPRDEHILLKWELEARRRYVGGKIGFGRLPAEPRLTTATAIYECNGAVAALCHPRRFDLPVKGVANHRSRCERRPKRKDSPIPLTGDVVRPAENKLRSSLAGNRPW